MSLETLDRSTQHGNAIEESHGEAKERNHLLNVADTIAAMEEQFSDVPPDEKQKLLAEKDRLIEELTTDRPGETLLNDVILLASVYQRRIIEGVLPLDGSRVKAFGTRDRHNQYLEETFILHEKPHGGYHYVVRRLTGEKELLFEIDDQAGLRIARHSKRHSSSAGALVDLHPDGEAYYAAVRELLETTLSATGEIRKRDESERATADMNALFMIEASSFAKQFLEAGSSAEVMHKIDAIMAVEPTVLSQQALEKIIKAA